MWYPIEKKWCTVFLFVVTTCVVRDNCCACTRYHSLAIIFTVPSPPQLNKCWSVHANPVTPYRLNCDPQHRKHATNATRHNTKGKREDQTQMGNRESRRSTYAQSGAPRRYTQHVPCYPPSCCSRTTSLGAGWAGVTHTPVRRLNYPKPTPVHNNVPSGERNIQQQQQKASQDTPSQLHRCHHWRPPFWQHQSPGPSLPFGAPRLLLASHACAACQTHCIIQRQHRQMQHTHTSPDCASAHTHGTLAKERRGAGEKKQKVEKKPHHPPQAPKGGVAHHKPRTICSPTRCQARSLVFPSAAPSKPRHDPWHPPHRAPRMPRKAAAVGRTTPRRCTCMA